MTYQELNNLVNDEYQKDKELEPGYVILPMKQFNEFKKVNEIHNKSNILVDVETCLGPIVVEGREDAVFPIVF